jgi:hypothetical protein
VRRSAGLIGSDWYGQNFTGSSVAVDPIDLLAKALVFIFSAPVLGAIAVIISGNFMSKLRCLTVTSDQAFKIPLLAILKLQASGAEVILGFAGFIVTLLIVGTMAGQPAYAMFRSSFGVDPGQFNSLCILSSFETVYWTFLLYLIGEFVKIRPDPIAKEHDRMINQISSGV